jgi:hypothetical protein
MPARRSSVMPGMGSAQARVRGCLHYGFDQCADQQAWDGKYRRDQNRAHSGPPLDQRDDQRKERQPVRQHQAVRSMREGVPGHAGICYGGDPLLLFAADAPTLPRFGRFHYLKASA